MPAVLLIAHGSKRPAANDDLRALARQVAETDRFHPVEIAFLELVEPNIPTGIERCVSQGADEVRLLPYFLSMGRHVAEHLEQYRAAAAQAHPDVKFTLRPPLGPHQKLFEIVMERIASLETNPAS